MIDADELLEILTYAKTEILKDDIPDDKKLLKLYGLNYAIVALDDLKNGE